MVRFAFSTARERLLSIIGVIAPLLVSAEHPLHEVEAILRDRIYEALDGLANFDFRAAWANRRNTSVVPSVEGTVEADADRVGGKVSPRSKKRDAGEVED
jgi:hypothetical protein